MSKSRKGFMDATDFYHELGEAAGGNTIYGSEEEVLKYSPCARECGIVEVDVHFVKTVLEDQYPKDGRTEQEIRLASWQLRLDNLAVKTERAKSVIQQIKEGKYPVNVFRDVKSPDDGL